MNEFTIEGLVFEVGADSQGKIMQNSKILMLGETC